MTSGRRDLPPPTDAEDEIAVLFDIAGPAPELPEVEVQPIRAAAREVWRRQQEARSRRNRFFVAAAVAASLSLVVGGVNLLRRPGPNETAVVATLVFSSGQVTIQATGPSDDPSTLGAGSVVVTGPNALAALRLEDGTSVRLASDSSLALSAARALTLDHGAVYVDSGNKPLEPVKVETSFGVVTDIGTQFEVRILPADQLAERLRVRVREGVVELRQGGRLETATAGQELIVDSKELLRGSLAADSEEWQWAVQAAPPLPIEGLPVPEFLDWVCREMGVEWHSTERPEILEQVILHGSIDGLTPDEALEIVLAGANLEANRVAGRLEVSLYSELPANGK